jgi:hypothetical protein
MQNCKPFGVGIHSCKEFLGYVHSDVWGPFPVALLLGKWYYIYFIDEYLRFTWVYFFREKSNVFKTFKGWKVQVETQTGNKMMRYLRSDNGGEYTFKEFERYCKERGILRHLTTILLCNKILLLSG